MINDLLDIAKLESGRAGLRCEEVDPQSLVQSAEDDLRPMVEARGSQLLVQIAPDLPRVSVDSRQIEPRLFKSRFQRRKALQNGRRDCCRGE